MLHEREQKQINKLIALQPFWIEKKNNISLSTAKLSHQLELFFSLKSSLTRIPDQGTGSPAFSEMKLAIVYAWSIRRQQWCGIWKQTYRPPVIRVWCMIGLNSRTQADYIKTEELSFPFDKKKKNQKTYNWSRSKLENHFGGWDLSLQPHRITPPTLSDPAAEWWRYLVLKMHSL